jgi:hypothetical protein
MMSVTTWHLHRRIRASQDSPEALDSNGQPAPSRAVRPTSVGVNSALAASPSCRSVRDARRGYLRLVRRADRPR